MSIKSRQRGRDKGRTYVKGKIGSRFVRVIESPRYSDYMSSSASGHKFDATGRRVR